MGVNRKNSKKWEFMGKAKKTKKTAEFVTVNVATPLHLLELIRAEAEKDGRKISQMIRRIIELHYQPQQGE